MTAYFPNFHELFLTRYCRDKLVCAPKCRQVIIASSDVPVVYPNIQKLLGPFYRNQKIANFNDVYEQLSHYLKAYPCELEKMNAILWRWIRENKQRHCRVKQSCHKNSKWLASRKHCNKVECTKGSCNKGVCCKSLESCDSKTTHTDWTATSGWKSCSDSSVSKSCSDSSVSKSCSTKFSTTAQTKSCSTKSKANCSGSTGNCHTKSSEWKPRTVSSKDCSNTSDCRSASKCGSDSSESSSDNESYSQSEHRSTKESKPSETCSESKYEGEECCPGDNFACEPKNHRVKWAIPLAKADCEALPCTGTLHQDLTCVVPSCLKDDEQLACLLADIVRHLL